MVTPAARRAWAVWVQEAFRVSVRRACRATGVHRSLLAYRFRKPPQEALRARLRELALARVSYGCLRLHTLLVREGWRVNRKRVHRLYREEGLQLRLRTQAARRRGKLRLPVFKGKGGMAVGVDPLSNKAMLVALGDDA